MLNFFKNEKTKALETQVTELESKCEKLSTERLGLKEEVEDLKLKKKISEEDIKHMVKMKEEKLELAHDKRLQAMVLEKQEEIGKIKDAYRDKTEQALEKQLVIMKEMYVEVLARLPNISAKLKL